MQNSRKIIAGLSWLNLAIIGLFPPYDDISISSLGVGVFAGFRYVFGNHTNLMLNGSLIYLEIAVVLINLCIMWLLTAPGRPASDGKGRFRRVALGLIILNLLGVLLFPPFESISNVTHAIIPNFEGFYFIFSHPPYRAIVTPILYLEVIFILINAGFILLATQPKQKTHAEDAMKGLASIAKNRGI